MLVAPRNGKYLGLVEGTKVGEAGMSVRRSPEYSRGICRDCVMYCIAGCFAKDCKACSNLDPDEAVVG